MKGCASPKTPPFVRMENNIFGATIQLAWTKWQSLRRKRIANMDSWQDAHHADDAQRNIENNGRSDQMNTCIARNFLLEPTFTVGDVVLAFTIGVVVGLIVQYFWEKCGE